MSRVFGVIYTDIWKPESDFRQLSSAAQRTFMLLVSQAEISPCGVLAMTVGRWAGMAADTTPAGIRKSITALEKSRHVVVDHDTEEVLIRSFIKWDKGYKHPKRLAGMRKSFDAVSSPVIHQAIVHELIRLGIAHLFGEPDAQPIGESNAQSVA